MSFRCSWLGLSSRLQRFLSNFLNSPFRFSLYHSVSVELEGYFRLALYIHEKSQTNNIVLLGCICEWLHRDSSKRLWIQTGLYTGCIRYSNSPILQPKRLIYFTIHRRWSISCSTFRNILCSINLLVLSLSYLAFPSHLEHCSSCWSV